MLQLIQFDVMTIHGDLKLVVPHQKPQIAGNEMVGIVDKVGSEVSRFKIGDRVFGRLPFDTTGAFAEYATVKENLIAKVPKGFNNEESAAIPLAALTILQALELLKPSKGETVFLSGGTGSLEQIAIPILKSSELKVITSGNSKNKEAV